MSLLAGRYELRETLGSGGMARVVAAYDRQLGRRVAVKFVHQHLLDDPTTRARLQREARAAATLHHPGTVTVHDVGEDAGQPFIVMELVDGWTLERLLRHHGPIDAHEHGHLMFQVLDALAAAHAVGLVHRDVKPSNVLVDRDGRAKLTDFGLAKAVDEVAASLTATGRVLGTPRYLAPELAMGHPATPASDVYAVGAMFYEAFSGRPPFDARTAFAVVLAHQGEPLTPLRQVADRVPPGIAAAVDRALAKDPRERFRDAASMRAALEVAATPRMTTISAAGVSSDDPRVAGRQRQLVGAGAATTSEVQHTRRLRTWPTRSGSEWPRWWSTVGVATLVPLAIVLTVYALPIGPAADDSSDTGSPPGTLPAEAEAARDPTGQLTDAALSDDVTTESWDRSFDDLLADLAAAPLAAGEDGNTLLERLLKIRYGDSGSSRGDDARAEVLEIAHWIDDGTLVPSYGERAVLLLEPLGRPPDPAMGEVSRLFARVAVEPAAWGERGLDLAGELLDLLDLEGSPSRVEVAELVDVIEKWIVEGELDETRGREAISVLRNV